METKEIKIDEKEIKQIKENEKFIKIKILNEN